MLRIHDRDAVRPSVDAQIRAVIGDQCSSGDDHERVRDGVKSSVEFHKVPRFTIKVYAVRWPFPGLTEAHVTKFWLVFEEVIDLLPQDPDVDGPVGRHVDEARASAAVDPLAPAVP